MNADDYLRDPCGASSLPFWKTERMTVPKHISIIREDHFDKDCRKGVDEPYFKLIHSLDNVMLRELPSGFETVECGIDDFARHINECYSKEGISTKELCAYKLHPVYEPRLWLAVAEQGSKRIAATGIAELDVSIGEGILEWIQVSPNVRRRGLGAFVVCELLHRMRFSAKFVTVSGRLNSIDAPIELYTSCGFSNAVIWHVVSER